MLSVPVFVMFPCELYSWGVKVGMVVLGRFERSICHVSSELYSWGLKVGLVVLGPI
jgi:hypothetical protein